MKSHSAVVKAFSEGSTDCKGSRVFAEGNVLYSFGRHFPLALRGDFGEGVKYLINGDTFMTGEGGWLSSGYGSSWHASHATAEHQQLAISSCKPNVQIPFSALAGARIDPWNVKLISHREDTWYYTCSKCGRETVTDFTREEKENEWLFHKDDNSPMCGGKSREQTSHHILGAVLFEAKFLLPGNDWEKKKFDVGYFLSSVDDNEPIRRQNSAYFLCRLPHRVETVDAAFEVLKPQAVVEAEAAGIEVRRQGDIFVIKTDVLTRQLIKPTEKYVRLQFDGSDSSSHTVTEKRLGTHPIGSTLIGTFVRGVMRHEPRERMPEHKRLCLGKTWWLAVRNTALGSWAAAGTVD